MSTVKYSPYGNQQFFNENGDPAVGWKINAYAAGSSTRQDTYTTEAGDVPQTNPIILDALGMATGGQVWLTSGQSYKLVLTDENDVVKDTQDNISGVNDTTTSVSQWQASGVTPTYVSTTSFTMAGDQTTEFHVDRRAQFTVTAGTVYGTILTTAYTTLTTVTMTMDSGQTLDSGLSAANLSILRSDRSAVPILKDTDFLISGSSDRTKKIRVEVDGITTDTTRVITVQNRDVTMQGMEYVTVAGTNTYTATYGLSAYVNGHYYVLFTNANSSTAPTLNLDSLGAITIKKNGGAALADGDIPANHHAVLSYDSVAACFILLNPRLAGATQADMESASSVGVFVTPSNIKHAPCVSKAGIKFTVSGGVPTAADTYNASSTVTDNGAGDFSAAWTTAFSSANYRYTLSTESNITTVPRTISVRNGGQAAGSLRVIVTDLTGAATDPSAVSIEAFGDQA